MWWLPFVVMKVSEISVEDWKTPNTLKTIELCVLER
jgi:hypothetical protein